MDLRQPALAWAAALALAFGPTAAAAEPDPVREDEQALKAVNLGVDGPALLDFFRKRTPVEANRTKIQALIAELGDDSYLVRDRASADLVAMGVSAAPLLREALKDEDIEVARRAEKCLQLIDPYASIPITTAAARLLAVRRPAGAAEVLLAYLPFADDEVVADAVRDALAAVARHDGKADEAIVAALEDKVPARRAAAVGALLRSGSAEQRRPLRKFLEDPEPLVRLEAALALIDARDREAVPVLVALLTELPLERCWPVEDVLCRLAGEQTPNVSLGADEAARKKCRDAWAGWWARAAAGIDLAKLDLSQRQLGYTLVVELNRGLAGRVRELDRDGQPRWQIDGLQYPIDAQVIGNDRVLIAEYRSHRVTERNFKGEVIWEKAVAGILQGVQRLPNGNTFVVTRNQLLEFDRDGKEVASLERPSHDVMAARKLRSGEIVLLTLAGMYVRLDAAGRELGHFPAGANYILGLNFDVLPSGRVVVPQYSQSKVVEFDAEGEKVWEHEVANPISVVRLPNGNTLIGSMVNQRAVEVDRGGKEVWEYKAEGRLMRVRRR
jgi:HEAT repeat protein